MGTIVFLCNVFPQARVIKWLNTFEDNGWNVVVLTCHHRIENQTWEYSFAINEFGNGDRRDMFPYSKTRLERVKSILRDKNIIPSLVFVRDIFQAHIGSIIADKYGVPMVLDIADNYPEVIRQIYGSIIGNIPSYSMELIEKKAVSRADIVLTVTNISKNLIKEKHNIKNKKVYTIRNMPSIKGVSSKENTVNKESKLARMVYIGTYSKKIRDLETVFKSLKETYSTGEFDLLHVYTSYVDLVTGIAKKVLGEKHINKVAIHPPIKNHNLFIELSRFDIGLVPHCRGPGTDFTEPNKLYDYVHAGIPVLASDNPSLVDTINKYKIGVNYRSNDVDSFLSAYHNILQNKERYARRCRDVSKMLTWERETTSFMSELKKFRK